MNEHNDKFEQEADRIRQERDTYHNISYKGKKQNYKSEEFLQTHKLFDYLSFIFLGMGFISLILMFFTGVTLLHATCLFLSYPVYTHTH